MIDRNTSNWVLAAGWIVGHLALYPIGYWLVQLYFWLV